MIYSYLYLEFNYKEQLLMKKDNKVAVFNQYETVSPATKLLEKRRKMYEIHEAFEGQKEEFRKQEMDFQVNETKIKHKDKELQEELTKFCQFLQENESKRKKAEEKIKQEEKAYVEKVDQINTLHKEIEELTKNQKKYMKRVIHLKKYEEYLETVRANYNDQYPDMADILTRYQTLKKSNDDLIKTREVMEHNFEVLKKQSNMEEKQLNQSILTINNEIKELSRRIEDKIHEKNEVQSEVEHSNEEYSKKNLNLGKIFMAIDNLNYRCNENSYKVKHDFDDKPTEKKETKAAKKLESDLANAKNEDEITYEQRSKHASSKLRNILSHMKDLKSIIDEYRALVKHGKQDKN